MANMKNVSMLAHAMRCEEEERKNDVHALIFSMEEELAALHQSFNEMLQRIRKLESGTQVSG